METVAFGFFAILGVVLQFYAHIVIPSFLAVKAVETFFPSFLSKDNQLPFWLKWLRNDAVLFLVLALTFGLLHHFVMPIPEIPSIQISTWAPLENLHHLYGNFSYPIAIVMFIARLIAIFCIGWKGTEEAATTAS